MKPGRKMNLSTKYMCVMIFVAFAYSASDRVAAHILNVGDSKFFSLVVTFSVAVGLSALVGWLMNRRTSRVFKELIGTARKISEGDLANYVSLERKTFGLLDETDELARVINIMLDSLKEVVGQIQPTADKIAESSHNLSATAEEMTASTEEIAATVADISKGAESQNDLIERANQAVREMANSIDLTNKGARDTAASALDASEAAEKSGHLAYLATEKMRGVFEEMEITSDLVMRFGEKSKRINRIVDVISGISQQTNLLALNATIEAARAGEYGRGFAVVADEVRKLAETTGKSAEQITDIVRSIEEESGRALESMKNSKNQIAEGREDVGTMGSSLSEIVDIVKEAAARTHDISQLSAVQTEGAQDMVKAIDEIQKVAEDAAASTEEVSAATEEQTATMEEMASAAQELSQLSEELRKMALRFSL